MIIFTPPWGRRGSTFVSCDFLPVVLDPEPEALVPLAFAPLVAAADPEAELEAGEAVLLASAAVLVTAADPAVVAAAESREGVSIISKQ